MIVIVMGVSGCGKSSVGRAIAAETGWCLIEGDDFHSPANRAKMAAGSPLADGDRWPWLDAIADQARRIDAEGRSVVIACSALKRIYRERLARAGDDVRSVHLAGDRETILRRLQARADHFMPPGLLDSQIATLEPPDADEPAWQVEITEPVSEIARQALSKLMERG